MKKHIYTLLFLLIGIVSFAQNPIEDIKLSPDEYFDKVFDRFGNEYKISNLKTNTDIKTKNGTMQTSAMLCSSGIFNLYFDPGSGMEIVGNTDHDARRAVVCQVFQDLSNFLNSPLKNPTNTNKVNIWIRNINTIQNFPAPASTSNVLGLASTFYTRSDETILDGEIWKTINSGTDSYTNSFLLLQPETSVGTTRPEVGFYHGMLAFNFDNTTPNWHTNLNELAPSNATDLYTVVLHEITHALGFNSLINQDGLSILGSLKNFTRYDLFLRDQNNNSIIRTGLDCSMYNYNFNTNSNTSVLHPGCTIPGNVFNGSTDHTNCADAIQYVGRSTVPVYTPRCYEPGRSFSHFEDEHYPICNSGNDDLHFTMSNANGQGVNKRFLQTEERNVLLDIGYSTITTYGNASHHSYINYGSTFSNNSIIAGINDGLNENNGTCSYFGYPNNPIQISGILQNDFTNLNGNDYFTNDIQNLWFECLEEMTNYGGNLSTTTGDSNTVIFYTNSTPGLKILKYVPYNFITGRRGNVTYIYLLVLDNSNCAIASQNNMIYNGDFEQNNSNIPSNLAQINKACGWKQVGRATPDYHHTNSPIQRNRIPCNEQGFQNVNNNTGNGYAGLANSGDAFITYMGGNTPYYEIISTKLVSPLQPNTTYRLCFDVSLAEGISAYAMKFQIYFSKNEVPFYAYANIPIDNPNMLFTDSSFATVTDDGSPLTSGWKKITFTFTTGNIAGEEFLYLGGIKNVQYQSLTPASQVSGCNYVNNNIDTPNLNHNTYYYVDNVFLAPFVMPTLNLPTQICTNSTIPDLSVYVTNPSSGAIFTGPGVINNNGTYSIDPSIAGNGTHTITYSNSSGCSLSVSDTITVGDEFVPEFDEYGVICSGEALPDLPTTSNNGITGTWSPAMNNTATTTYTFTPSAGQCATSQNMTVVVEPRITPTFESMAPICHGTTTNPLQNVSTNDISGNWTPAFNNTATTTYTFTPSIGQCSNNTTITITILPSNDPSCSENNCIPTLTLSSPEPSTNNYSHTYNVTSWIECNNDYEVNGQIINLFAGKRIVLKPDTYIHGKSVFLAKIQTCPEDVYSKTNELVNVTNSITVYPNPTLDFFTINSSEAKLKSVEIMSIEGKVIFTRNDLNSNRLEIDFTKYQNGIYIVNIATSDNKVTSQKIIKN